MTSLSRICAALLLAATPVKATIPLPLSCEGNSPDWFLDVLSENDVRFRFAGRETRFAIPQETAAEGRSWPYAMTLLAHTDTAFLLFEREDCETASLQADMRLHIFTQRGDTPTLLTGCCLRTE